MTAEALKPSFEMGSRGRLHVARFLPCAKSVRSVVVVAQPFAEEANRSRRMIAIAARALAGRGHAVVVPDLYGTLDSEGDFGDARWDDWVGDLVAIAGSESAQAAAPMALLGVRAGALLLPEVLSALPQCQRVVHWAPVARGEQALTQFLRLRTAARMMEGKGETVNDLRAQLAAGDALEIAGYRLSPELANALDASGLLPPNDHAGGISNWFSLGTGVPPALRGVMEAWASAGWHCESAAVQGDSFWATQEIATAPALARATVEALEGPPGMGCYE